MGGTIHVPVISYIVFAWESDTWQYEEFFAIILEK